MRETRRMPLMPIGLAAPVGDRHMLRGAPLAAGELVGRRDLDTVAARRHGKDRLCDVLHFARGGWTLPSAQRSLERLLVDNRHSRVIADCDGKAVAPDVIASAGCKLYRAIRQCCVHIEPAGIGRTTTNVHRRHAQLIARRLRCCNRCSKDSQCYDAAGAVARSVSSVH